MNNELKERLAKVLYSKRNIGSNKDGVLWVNDGEGWDVFTPETDDALKWRCVEELIEYNAKCNPSYENWIILEIYKVDKPIAEAVFTAYCEMKEQELKR